MQQRRRLQKRCLRCPGDGTALALYTGRSLGEKVRINF